MIRTIRRLRHVGLAMAVGGSLALLAIGCGGRASTLRQNDITLESPLAALEFNPPVVLSVYAYGDRNTADVVMSSWTVAELRAFAEGERIRPGGMLHLHYFLTPAAGRTPIDFTAQNCTLKYLLLPSDRGEIAGLYSGGGFLLPSGPPGELLFIGVMRDGSLRPIAQSTGFTDILGAASVNMGVAAQRDEATTTVLLDWMDRIAASRLEEAN